MILLIYKKYLMLFSICPFIRKLVLISMSGSSRNDVSLSPVSSLVSGQAVWSDPLELCSMGYHGDASRYKSEPETLS